MSPTAGSTGRSTFLNTDTTWAAKGDIAVATANDAGSVLTVGSNGQQLVADSSTTSGLRWSDNQFASNTFGMLGMTMHPMSAVSQITPSAATIFLTKLPIPYSLTITNLIVNIAVAGTNYTNTQLGLYASDGTFLKATAVLASGGTNTFGSVGDKTVALSSSQAVTGGATVFVWVAVHMGTNNATAVKIMGRTDAAGAGGAAAAGSANFGLAAASAYAVSQTGHATNALATIGNLTPASGTLSSGAFLIGIS